MTDNKKTQRSFQCRDALWERFEQMSRELECSVDYLINEAMKLYVRQREGGSVAARPPGSGQYNAATPPPRVPPSAPPPPPRAPSAGAKPPAFPAPPPAAAAPPLHSGQLPNAHLPSAPMNLPGIPTGHLGGAGPMVPPLPPSRLPAPGAPRPPAAPSMAGSPAGGVSQVVPPVPRGPSRVAPPPPSRSAGPPQLSIYYGGERFVVNKDKFIIGRGRQTSDLTIKDPNVSRQHALVERVNGQYYIVDLGSTNGVEYAGQRVERRLISNGDVYRVCDHDLRFSFA